MTSDPAAIAARLTDAQRRALATPAVIPEPRLTELCDLAILERISTYPNAAILTPLGQRVRAPIADQEAAHAR